jgi:TruD family tRNA pseudouridine synthase
VKRRNESSVVVEVLAIHTCRSYNLLGNRFEIVIRNIDKKIDTKNIQKTISFMEKYGGFPNFYGIQRFGIVRPVTHIIGKNKVNLKKSNGPSIKKNITINKYC